MKKHSLGEITTQGIAAEAGVSTATVYRWWDTKEALLVDAFLHVKRQNVQMAQSGSPLHRLREYSIAGGKFLQGEHGLVAARVLGAIQDDAKLREHFTERFYVPHLSEMMEVAKQAVDAGELPSKTNLRLFVDMQFGTCLARMLLRREPIRWQDFRRRRLISPLQGRRATGVSFAKSFESLCIKDATSFLKQADPLLAEDTDENAYLNLCTGLRPSGERSAIWEQALKPITAVQIESLKDLPPLRSYSSQR